MLRILFHAEIKTVLSESKNSRSSNIKDTSSSAIEAAVSGVVHDWLRLVLDRLKTDHKSPRLYLFVLKLLRNNSLCILFHCRLRHIILNEIMDSVSRLYTV